MSFHSEAWARLAGAGRRAAPPRPPPTGPVMLGLHLLHLLCQLLLPSPGLKGLGLGFAAEALLNALFFQSRRQEETRALGCRCTPPHSSPHRPQGAETQ